MKELIEMILKNTTCYIGVHVVDGKFDGIIDIKFGEKVGEQEEIVDDE